MLLPHGAVVAVIDGEHLNLFKNSGNEQEMKLTAMDSPKLSTEGGPSASKSSGSANPEAGEHGEDAYVRHAADYLNNQVLGHKIEKLAVIAAPRALGELRKHWHKQTEAAIVTELSKTLTNASVSDIESALHAAR